MNLIDSFYDVSLYDEIVRDGHSKETSWNFARTDLAGEAYWTNYVFGSKLKLINSQSESVQEWQFDSAMKAWDFAKDKLSIPEYAELESCYFNGMTFGQNGHPHVDCCDRDCCSHIKYTTIITYVCAKWNAHWGGETVFFTGKKADNLDDDSFYNTDVIASVLPKPNRVIVFDGKIMHAVRPVTRLLNDMRITLMFKIKNVDPKDLSYNFDGVKQIRSCLY